MKLDFAAARLLAALLLLASTVPIAGHARQPSPAPDAVRAAWGFDRSDLTPHPDVRFGVLANGMRYALLPNASPAGGLSVRLHIAAGAAVEGPREQGFMHLLEHMIFHGSENIPEGALPLMLSHRGLKRWTDFNAYTSYDETVYRLDLSRADSGARETALTLMRDISSRLLLTRQSVAGAIAKVQEEIGGRDALQDRSASAQNAFFLPGTPLARGPVAGTKASVGRADAEALRRLYERHYVPERATLVLVGDFDAAQAEAEISSHFSNWQARATDAASRPPPLVQIRRGTETYLFVDRAAPTTVTLAFVRPIGGAGDTGLERDSRFLAGLGSEMLARRLSRLAATSQAPFVGASAAIYDHFSTARLASIELPARNRDWGAALRGGALELRRALDGGFTQAELDEQLAASRRALAGGSAPRTSPALADAIVDAVGRGLVFTRPGDPKAADAYLAGVRLADVNAAFRSAWASPNRLIFVSHNRPIAKARQAIEAVWAQSQSSTPDPVSRQAPGSRP
jgi:zinc protease